jgi:tetratricopeptide (TPR) repeat protein
VSTGRVPLPQSYEGLRLQAQAALHAGDLPAATDLYRRVLDSLSRLGAGVRERRPDLHEIEAQTRMQLYDLLGFEGRHAEAIEVLAPLVTSHPDQSDLWRGAIAVARIAKGEVDAGLAQLQDLAQAQPDDARRWLVLGSEARLEGQREHSQSALDRALVAARDAAPELQANIHHERFFLLRDLGRMDEAAAAWERAIELDPSRQDSVSEVYTMLTEAGRYSDALSYVARDENPLRAGFQRGLIAQRLGQMMEARKEWQAVAETDPAEYDDGHEAWAEAVLRQGNQALLLERLQPLLSGHATPRLLVLTGMALAMNGDTERAGRFFQQAIHIYRRLRPPRQKLDRGDWQLLTTLVRDDKVKEALKAYFVVIETLWS